MMLADWVAKLRTAAAAAPADPLFAAAQRAATRATVASGGRFSFHVERTRAGAKIIGFSLVGAPRRLGDDAVRHALGGELERARAEIADQLRGRLSA